MNTRMNRLAIAWCAAALALAACGKNESGTSSGGASGGSSSAPAPSSAAQAPAPAPATAPAPAPAPAEASAPAPTASATGGGSAAAAGPGGAVATAGNVGEDTYNKTCMACHAAGVTGAPKLGDKADWGTRTPQGKDTLYKHAIEGYTGQKGTMPPKGGNTQLSDEQVRAAVDFMVARGS